MPSPSSSPDQTSPASADSSGASPGGQPASTPQPFDPRELVRQFQKMERDAQLLFGFLRAVLQNLAHVVTYPALLLLRSELGQRVLSTPAFLSSWLPYCLVAVASQHPMAILLVPVIPLSFITKRITAARRQRRGERHYSYCRGDSWFAKLLPGRPALTEGLLDPLLLVGLGVLAWCFPAAWFHETLDITATVTLGPAYPAVLAVYLLLAGVSLFVAELLLRERQANVLLDHIDQQIISTYLASALDGTEDPVADEGFGIAQVESWTPEQRSMFVEAGNHQLDPELAALLDPSPMANATGLWTDFSDPQTV